MLVKDDLPDGHPEKCNCGRSPTGRCLGWHNFTEEEYQAELEKAKTAIPLVAGVAPRDIGNI